MKTLTLIFVLLFLTLPYSLHSQQHTQTISKVAAVRYEIASDGKLKVTTDGGENWKNILKDNIRATYVVWNQQNPKNVAVSTRVRILISADGGNTWTTTLVPGKNITITRLGISIEQPDMLFCTGMDNATGAVSAWLSRDGGRAWIKATDTQYFLDEVQRSASKWITDPAINTR
ncbi:MAG: WD40/YVTN/BNR-like repeat-containing protein [Bacteroidota bacterium]